MQRPEEAERQQPAAAAPVGRGLSARRFFATLSPIIFTRQKIMFIFAGQEIETDSDGYLKDTTLWSEPLAEKIAENEGITLSPEHWEVVRFVREFYLEFNTSPAIRMLVKAMANTFGEEKGNSRYLYRLFPKGPAKQATKIAGLPKPVKCI